MWDPDVEAPPLAAAPQNDLNTPLNKALEEGSWTQSIIWGPREPFRDFTQLELHEQEAAEERPAGMVSRVSFLTYALISGQYKTLPAPGNACVPIRNHATSSISRTISSTKSPRMEDDIVCGRPLVSLSWSMHIPLRNCSCLSYVSAC